MQRKTVRVAGPGPTMSLAIPFGQRHGLGRAINNLNRDIDRRGGNWTERAAGRSHLQDIRFRLPNHQSAEGGIRLMRRMAGGRDLAISYEG